MKEWETPQFRIQNREQELRIEMEIRSIAIQIFAIRRDSTSNRSNANLEELAKSSYEDAKVFWKVTQSRCEEIWAKYRG